MDDDDFFHMKAEQARFWEAMAQLLTPFPPHPRVLHPAVLEWNSTQDAARRLQDMDPALLGDVCFARPPSTSIHRCLSNLVHVATRVIRGETRLDQATLYFPRLTCERTATIGRELMLRDRCLRMARVTQRALLLDGYLGGKEGYKGHHFQCVAINPEANLVVKPRLVCPTTLENMDEEPWRRLLSLRVQSLRVVLQQWTRLSKPQQARVLHFLNLQRLDDEEEGGGGPKKRPYALMACAEDTDTGPTKRTRIAA
jgi:hypothetical protein